jgi:hypothetical protein
MAPGLMLATQQSQGPGQPLAQRPQSQQVRRGVGAKRGGGRSRPAMEGF